MPDVSSIVNIIYIDFMFFLTFNSLIVTLVVDKSDVLPICKLTSSPFSQILLKCVAEIM